MFKLRVYLKDIKFKTILIPILVLIESLSEVLIPVFMGLLIDRGIKHGDMSLIYQYGGIMVFLAILSLIFGIAASRLSVTVSAQFAKNLRHAQYENIQTFSFENIDKFSSASLITRMTLDVNMIQNTFQMLIRVVFRAPALLFFSIISSFLVAGKIGFVFVGIIPVLGFGLFIIIRGAHRYFRKMFLKIDNLNVVVQEDLSGMRTIKSYVQEDYEIDRFNQAARDVSKYAVKAERWTVFNAPLIQFSVGVAFVLIGWFGSYNMVYHGLEQGQFANVITYVMQVMMSLMMISNIFLFILISKASFQRVIEVLEEESTLKEITNPIKEVKDGSIVFKDVCFKYGKDDSKPVLNKFNLEIPSGAFVGVFGATGTGKTTFAQLIPRLYDATSGEVIVGGVNVKDYELDKLREAVILVLQKNVLFSGTLRENIQYGKEDATDEEIISVLKKAQAYEFVSKWEEGLDYKIEQGGVNVSGGQRQRLTIARALIGNPQVLILDDSTSAVDTKTDSEIRKMFKKENIDMTKIVISQRISSIQEADMIIILDDEGINQVGNHEELYKTNEIYKSVYNAQYKGSDQQ